MVSDAQAASQTRDERLGVIFTAEGIAYQLGNTDPVHLVGGQDVVEKVARLAMKHGRDVVEAGGVLFIAIEAPEFSSVSIVRKPKDILEGDWYDPAGPQYETRVLAIFMKAREEILNRNGAFATWESIPNSHG